MKPDEMFVLFLVLACVVGIVVASRHSKGHPPSAAAPDNDALPPADVAPVPPAYNRRRSDRNRRG